MSNIYEEVEIEDMEFDEQDQMYYYPCPCGDKFRISLEDLYDGEDVAKCPSCTLRIMVIYDEEDLPPLPDEEDDDQDEEDESLGAEQEPVLEKKLGAISIKS